MHSRDLPSVNAIFGHPPPVGPPAASRTKSRSFAPNLVRTVEDAVKSIFNSDAQFNFFFSFGID
jgi:hypothetical protein